MLLFKLCITPLLMGMATLVTRRWGPVVGGIFTALPLTAGPVSAFLLLEQGQNFAADAARASMLGYAALAFFILAFERMGARGLCWQVVCLGSSVTYFGFAWLFSFLPRSGLLAFVVSMLCLALVLRAIPCTGKHWETPRAAWWDLPLRMVAAGGLVLGITAVAKIIGPQWSGFLSTYPVFITLMGVFTLVQAGMEPVRMLMRGFVGGMFGAVIFFFVLRLALPHMHAVAAYALAALVNFMVCGADLWLSRHSLQALRRCLRLRRHPTK